MAWLLKCYNTEFFITVTTHLDSGCYLNLMQSVGSSIIHQWLAGKQWQPFAFQSEAWEAIAAGESGIVNAP
ncbi:MAG TPA: hypothetical protein DCL43_13610, partial [Chitinophagaceae bacterium]|nr:hypothetical protein [Chitinophagaceae bacterium]